MKAKYLIILILLFFGTHIAKADSFIHSVTTPFMGADVNVTLDSVIDTPSTVYAGMMNTQVGPSPSLYPGSSFFTFSIDLHQANSSTAQTYGLNSLQNAPSVDITGGDELLMGSNKASLVTLLWSNYFDQVTSVETAAAFQLAIWEIVYDDGLDLQSGQFKASDVFLEGDVNEDGSVDLADLAKLATSFGMNGNENPEMEISLEKGDITGDNVVDLADLAKLATNFGQSNLDTLGIAGGWLVSLTEGSMSADANLVAFTNSDYQDLITEIPSFGSETTQVVPVPMAYYSWLLGIAFLWSLKRTGLISHPA